MKKIAIAYEVVQSDREYLLARVALVDENLSCIYDKFVAPSGQVTNYRTPRTGITEDTLRDAPSFEQVREEVANLISGCLLIGHSIVDIKKTTFICFWTNIDDMTDLVHLGTFGLDHPDDNMRDVAYYRTFRPNAMFQMNSIGQLKYVYGGRPSLKDLAWRILKERIPNGDTVEAAKAAMKLYLSVASKWQ
ncbi:hypothetical protein ABMA28_012500 [Loxostege sticticalis]|uniref:Exonuclease domain-containing protein n=1 Tax=Loxostege sticticalis TaxID=481309 RepID=A0ABD0S684_LOXSC